MTDTDTIITDLLNSITGNAPPSQKSQINLKGGSRRRRKTRRKMHKRKTTKGKRGGWQTPKHRRSKSSKSRRLPRRKYRSGY
jgi:hypothetical protein